VFIHLRRQLTKTFLNGKAAMRQYRPILFAGILLMIGTHATSQPPRGNAPFALPDEEAPFGVPAKALAKAKFAALHADPKELARAKVDAAGQNFEAQYREFLAGRVSVPGLLEAQLLVLEAELAVSDTDEKRVALYEKRWEQAWAAENYFKAFFEGGRVNLQDYAQYKYNRLDAEIQWKQARAKLQKKEPVPLPPAMRR
jgi:hypothetical protein